jgi:hypothetical protein
MVIVKFKDGKYGIRRKRWFCPYEYLDLKTDQWWTRGSRWFSGSCCSFDLSLVNNTYNAYNVLEDIGTPI